jgi:hypothetical protein
VLDGPCIRCKKVAQLRFNLRVSTYYEYSANRERAHFDCWKGAHLKPPELTVAVARQAEPRVDDPASAANW